MNCISKSQTAQCQVQLLFLVFFKYESYWQVGRGSPGPSPKANTPVEISAPTPRTTARGSKRWPMKQEPEYTRSMVVVRLMGSIPQNGTRAEAMRDQPREKRNLLEAGGDVKKLTFFDFSRRGINSNWTALIQHHYAPLVLPLVKPRNRCGD